MRIRRTLHSLTRGSEPSPARTVMVLLATLGFTVFGFAVSVISSPVIFVYEEHHRETSSEVKAPDVLLKRFRLPFFPPKLCGRLTDSPSVVDLLSHSQWSQSRCLPVVAHFLGSGVRIRC